MPGATEVQRLVTRKGVPGDTRIERIERSLLSEPGQVILAPDLFSLTTNNITYAAFGDALGYDRVTAMPEPWLRLVTGEGYDAAQDVIARLSLGTVPLGEGHVVRV